MVFLTPLVLTLFSSYKPMDFILISSLTIAWLLFWDCLSFGTRLQLPDAA